MADASCCTPNAGLLLQYRAMPELPEVETTRRGILPRLQGRTLIDIKVRNPSLRWPVPADLERQLAGKHCRPHGAQAAGSQYPYDGHVAA
jgi:hypothetical protein